MGQAQKDYEKLHSIAREIRHWQGISELLGWDQETYMPQESGEIRGEQLKMLAGLIHKERTGPKFTHALEKLINIESGTIKAHDLAADLKAGVQVWHRDYKRETSLPLTFVEDFALLCAESQLVWRTAKKKSDFNQVLAQYQSIDSAVLVLRPFWKTSFPNKSKSIQVIVNYPQ